MSLWFYAYFHMSYLVIILCSVLVNYVISRLLINEKSPVWIIPDD